MCFSFFFSLYADHRVLHSFPTRRSSDLPGLKLAPPAFLLLTFLVQPFHEALLALALLGTVNAMPILAVIFAERLRSEEHTSELQSQFHLVCRLLLEKKNIM